MDGYLEKRRYGLAQRRDQICDILAQAYTDNHIELEDYEHRLDLVNAADSIDELETVLHDFPAVYQAPRSASADRSVERSTNHPAETRLSIIGDCRIDHQDFGTGEVRTFALIGDVKADLENLPPLTEPVVLTVFSLIGDTKVIIPPGMRVENQLVNVIGDTELFRRDGSVENSAVGRCIIRGLSLIGDVKIVEAGYRKKRRRRD
ncbi:MAG: LiaF-related protein [Spirochaeta sp.]|jgi:hypothetical protein|nr:LiaF-related protein [Spirochaeta sp.]